MQHATCSMQQRSMIYARKYIRLYECMHRPVAATICPEKGLFRNWLANIHAFKRAHIHAYIHTQKALSYSIEECEKKRQRRGNGGEAAPIKVLVQRERQSSSHESHESQSLCQDMNATTLTVNDWPAVISVQLIWFLFFVFMCFQFAFTMQTYAGYSLHMGRRMLHATKNRRKKKLKHSAEKKFSYSNKHHNNLNKWRRCLCGQQKQQAC